ncbi:U6 snRNA phosphodiesterase [Bradysia coprophila]|uniref:U6 snRNA phosphodiesterase n=1 Tax=Bradysia coprophila TaxID=38358 RepID=UPI00187D8BF2|nr:U6 snRNA phosphodiesterase [Bradysia coprophila]
MSLVDYNLSDDDEEESHNSDEYHGSSAKKRCLISSASTNGNQEKSEKDDVENTGRVRTFPHERGNWATFIYVPVPFSDSIREIQSQIASSCEKDLDVQLHLIESIHISLTRTVVLQHHWIDDFKKSIRECIVDFKRFPTSIDTLSVYCNDDCTTTFVAIAVPDVYCAPLKALVEKFDRCLSEYKLPFFYEDASFHVSILWCAGNKKAKIQTEIDKLQQMLNEAIEDDCDDYQFVVNRIECKIGNKIYDYPLLS